LGKVDKREKTVTRTFATLLLIVIMALACIGVFGFVTLVLGPFIPAAVSPATASYSQTSTVTSSILTTVKATVSTIATP
jgi:hypothetical protein